MRYFQFPGIMSTEELDAVELASQSANFANTIEFMPPIKIAPTTAPGMLPSPPTIAIESAIIEN